MDRINLRSLYELGYMLHPLTTQHDTTNRGDFVMETGLLRLRLGQLRRGDPVELRNETPVKTLLEAIEEVVNKPDGEEGLDWYSGEIEGYRIKHISQLASNLEVILFNEFPLCHSYMISEEGLESIDTLIQNPQKAFDRKTISELESCAGNPLDDFKESARCLAFGFSTACGFHVVRAAEAVLRKWHQLIKPQASDDTQWNNCIRELIAENKNEQDDETKRRVGGLLSMLDSLRDANRNPLMHPEMSLDPSQATSLFKLTTSLISSMTREIIRIQRLAH